MTWMKISTMMMVTALAAPATLIACDEDDEDGATPGATDDAGAADARPVTRADGGRGAGEGDAGESDADASGRPPRAAPVFLPAEDYATLLAIDGAFPFGVTAIHAATSAVAGSRWGAHGGPIVTTGVYGAGGAPGPKVLRWTFGAGPKTAATMTERPIAKAPSLPAQLFYGADGMVDTPFGGLLSYSTGAAPFAGEALLYDGAYGALKSRAHVNGFYSGVGLRGPGGDVVAYSGLSVFSAAATADADNGFFVAPLCEGALVGPPPCAEGRRLFGWRGNSGPVAADAHGNVFVSASLQDGDTSDAVYAVARDDVFGPAPIRPVSLVAIDSLGTASLAAVAPEGAAEGWVLGLGYDPEATVYAAPYEERGAALAPRGAPLARAITRAAGVETVHVFTDDEGDLWLALTRGDDGAFVELRRRP